MRLFRFLKALERARFEIESRYPVKLGEVVRKPLPDEGGPTVEFRVAADLLGGMSLFDLVALEEEIRTRTGAGVLVDARPRVPMDEVEFGRRDTP